MTQAEFAKRLGVEPSLYSRVSRGERRVPARFLLRVLKVFPDLRRAVEAEETLLMNGRKSRDG